MWHGLHASILSHLCTTGKRMQSAACKAQHHHPACKHLTALMLSRERATRRSLQHECSIVREAAECCMTAHGALCFGQRTSVPCFSSSSVADHDGETLCVCCVWWLSTGANSTCHTNCQQPLCVVDESMTTANVVGDTIPFQRAISQLP